MGPILATLNIVLPQIIAFYKSMRDATPNQPSLTDAQIIDLLHTDSAEIEAKAKSWLSAHPKPVAIP